MGGVRDNTTKKQRGDGKLEDERKEKWIEERCIVKNRGEKKKTRKKQEMMIANVRGLSQKTGRPGRGKRKKKKKEAWRMKRTLSGKKKKRYTQYQHFTTLKIIFLGGKFLIKV